MGTATRPGGASAGDREAAKPGGAEAAAAAVGAGTTANRTGTTSDRAGTASGTTDAAASRTDASTGRTGTAASRDGGTAGSTDTAPSSGDAARRTGTTREPADAAARTGTASEPAGAGTGRTGTATGTAGKASRGDAGGTAAAATATPAAGTDKAAEKGGVGGPVSVERLPTRLDLNKARHAAAAQNTLFRLGDLVHSDARPRPDGGQMLGVCAWATALVLAGIGVAIRGLLAIVGGVAPAWYQPALVGTGLIGLALTVAAFVTIQRRHIPWFLLALATIPLAAAIALTIIAL